MRGAMRRCCRSPATAASSTRRANSPSAVRHKIPLVTVVFNNNAYGNVRLIQQEWYGGRTIASDLVNPDFVKFADSFGAASERVENPDELRAALRRGFNRRERPDAHRDAGRTDAFALGLHHDAARARVTSRCYGPDHDNQRTCCSLRTYGEVSFVTVDTEFLREIHLLPAIMRGAACERR